MQKILALMVLALLVTIKVSAQTNGPNETFGASPSASAAANTAAIQSALNAATGGCMTLLTPGVYQINATLVISSNTCAKFGPNTVIRTVTGGAGVPVLVNSAFNTRATTTAVTITWTSGNTFSVAWTGHPFPLGSHGQYVILSGSPDTLAQNVFNGIFAVASVTDANNFVVTATRTPSVNQSGGAPVAKVADVNISIEGGIFDYNYPTNTAPASALAAEGIIIANAEHVTIKDVKSNNAYKYAFFFGAVRDLDVENVGSDFTDSDELKVIGPAYNIKISHVWGHGGDDGVTFDSYDPSFPQYFWAGGGDIQNIDVGPVAYESTQANVKAVGLNATPNEYFDNASIHDVTGCGSGVAIAPVVFSSNATSGTSLIHTAKVSNVGGCTPSSYVAVTTGYGGTIALDTLDISQLSVDPLANFNSALVNVSSTGQVNELNIRNVDVNSSVWPTSGGTAVVQIGGKVIEANIDTVSMTAVGSGSAFILQPLVGSTLTKANLSHINQTAGSDTIHISGDTVVPTLSITDSNISTTQVLNTGTSVNASFLGNVLNNASGGVVHISGSVAVNYLMSNNTFTGTTVEEVTTSGSPTINAPVSSTTVFKTPAPATFSAVGAASIPGLTVTGAPYTGGTGTTTLPQLYMNAGGAVNSFSSAGTEFGINAPSGFAGYFWDMHVNGGNSVSKLNSSGSLSITNLIGNTSGHLLFSGTAPTISSGFGSAPSIVANNGTATFTINVGTGGSASTGVIGLPTATNGWACFFNDQTSPQVNETKQTGNSTTSVSVTNYNTTLGTAAAWTAGDILIAHCWAF